MLSVTWMSGGSHGLVYLGMEVSDIGHGRERYYATAVFFCYYCISCALWKPIIWN